MSNSNQDPQQLEELTAALRDLSVPEGPGPEAKSELLRRIQETENQTLSVLPTQTQGGHTMRRYFATAATILVLLGGYLFLLPSADENPGNLFAAMLDQVKQVSTATLQVKAITPGADEITTKISLLDPGWMRQEILLKDKLVAIQIMDQRDGKMLSLQPDLEQAVFIDMSDMPERKKQESIIEELRKLPSEIAVFEGQEMLGELATSKFVYHFNGMNYTMWISAETKMPVQIVMADHVDPTQAEFLVTMTDFDWGAKVDESLFTLEPPEGYELKEQKLDLATGTASDFVVMLRTFVRLNDGKFPPAWNALTPATIGKLVMPNPDAEKEEQQKEVIKKMATALGKPADKQYSKEDATALANEMQQVVIRGSTYFAHMVERQVWHYQGDGVTLGEADKIVGWWYPKPEKLQEGEDPDTAQVLYGDLRVETLPKSELPQIEAESD